MSKDREPEQEKYSDDEAAQRRDEVIKRMLNTPPQPRRAKQGVKGTKEPAPKARSKRPS